MGGGQFGWLAKKPKQQQTFSKKKKQQKKQKTNTKHPTFHCIGGGGPHPHATPLGWLGVPPRLFLGFWVLGENFGNFFPPTTPPIGGRNQPFFNKPDFWGSTPNPPHLWTFWGGFFRRGFFLTHTGRTSRGFLFFLTFPAPTNGLSKQTKKKNPKNKKGWLPKHKQNIFFWLAKDFFVVLLFFVAAGVFFNLFFFGLVTGFGGQ